MKKNRVIISLLMFILCNVVKPNLASSEPEKDLSFSVTPIFPNNQSKENSSYFDLKMEPSQHQTVKMILENNTDEDIKINIHYNNAKTNSNGVRDYSTNPLLEEDESLKVKFNDIVTGPSDVVLLANSNTEVPIGIQMPENKFDGSIAGGIQFKKISDNKQGKDKTNVVLDLSYTLGMKLRETDKKVAQSFGLRTIKPGFINYESAFLVSVANTRPIFIDDLMIDSTITKKGKEDKIYRNKKQNIKMSPNSKIDFPVSLDGEDMVAGNYLATIKVETKEGYKKSWEEAFIVTKKDASFFNTQQEIFNEDISSFNWKGTFGIVFIILVILGLSYFVYKKTYKIDGFYYGIKKGKNKKGRK